MNTEQRLEKIRDSLARAFDPESLVVEDEGHLHVGHEGARDGRGHFRVMIVSAAFNGQSMRLAGLENPLRSAQLLNAFEISHDPSVTRSYCSSMYKPA